ncbi:Short-chain dehydrogenase [Candidatus Filomicrobium marinum]|uniref:Short-chain dehydrogenase n=1 Tax=Candidatus Filomicrobium marinum TaxID=1608628 RepID=A0A0D6J9T0_9HYPH|nr:MULTISPECIES: SDR family oxidoreductase [Filomicrobium]MCV0368826.1 SDR family oxidoreductase [Filomicrobium sp.]CFW98014.1 Short-chain dehydrogenase [Candidatus Filomicrobium marinum]CPR14822.1 Short-chain dehydrogenase [Candidatus Filomicrobium marinum]
MSTTATGTPDTVLITGAARRIGRALALDLARHGWRVAIHCRHSRGEAEELAHEITTLGSSAAVLDCDLADSDAVAKLIPRCADALAQPVCLINNASAFLPDSVAEMTEEIWNTHLDINLRTPVFLARALYVDLPSDKQGNVINIIDQRVWRLTPEFFSYTISKSGLWTATRTLAQAMAPRVRVNAIGPGPVLKSIHQTDADFAAEAESTLLGRGPTPEEVAAAARFILAAPALTGQMIALDGGQHLTWANEPRSGVTQPNKG